MRHDLWDMDVPAQPSLIDIQTEEGGAGVGGAANRATSMCWTVAGEPILPVREVPAPRGGRRRLGRQDAACVGTVLRTAEAAGQDLWGATLIDQMMCHIQFHSLRYEGRYAALHGARWFIRVTSASSTGWGGG